MDVFGDRNMVLARELTKIHEEFLRGKISEILPIVPELKGEMVIVMEGNQEDYSKDVDMSAIMDMVQDSINAGLSTKDAIKDTAARTGIAKNKIYEEFHNKGGQC
jgi:16S rRNA (cytidine1402-2'-O)-methyltransferase